MPFRLADISVFWPFSVACDLKNKGFTEVFIMHVFTGVGRLLEVLILALSITQTAKILYVWNNAQVKALMSLLESTVNKLHVYCKIAHGILTVTISV